MLSNAECFLGRQSNFCCSCSWLTSHALQTSVFITSNPKEPVICCFNELHNSLIKLWVFLVWAWLELFEWLWNPFGCCQVNWAVCCLWIQSHGSSVTKLKALGWALLRIYAQLSPAPLIAEDKLKRNGVYFLPNYIALWCNTWAGCPLPDETAWALCCPALSTSRVGASCARVSCAPWWRISSKYLI